jgi:hypothetical protein
MVCLMDLLIFPDSRALAHLGFPDVDLRSYCRIRGKFLFCCFSQNTFFLIWKRAVIFISYPMKYEV